MIEFQLQIQLFLLLCLVNRISLKTRSSCSIPFSPGISNLELYYHDDPLSVYYLWNKTDVSAVDYHKNFCAERCDQGVKKIAPSYTTNIQCLECECQKPACEIYDICCEEISDTQNSSNRSIAVTVSSKLNCDSKSNPSFYFLYLRECPASYNESEAIRRLCLEDVNVTETTLDTYMRVIDNETQVVYYNYFCARCNNVKMPIRLDLNVSCTSYMLVYMAESINDLIRLMLLDLKHCHIYQNFQPNLRPLSCYDGQFSQYQINQCDKDDPRKMIDPDIVEACDQINGTKYQIYSLYKNTYYKNIFCSICDLMTYPFLLNEAFCVDDFGHNTNILYQMLIHFHDIDQDQENTLVHTCNETTWASPSNGDCLQLRCSPGKTLTNGTCSSIFTDITGLVYRVRALLVLHNMSSTTENMTNMKMMDMAIKQITKDVSTISDDYSYQLGVVQEVDGNLTDKVTPVVWLDLFVLATRRLARDSFENIALDIFFGEHREEDNVFVLNNLLTNELFGYYSSINSLIWPKREKMSVNLTFYNSLYFGFQHNIILSSTLTCCFLTFQQDNFTIEWNSTNQVDNLMVTVDVAGTKINISTVSDINSMEVTEQRELHICLNVLDKYFNKSTKSSYLMKPISVALNILTYSCMCASELCLLLTLITYLRFSELRTVPGINNIFLSLSLLLSQLALIVTSNIQGPSVLCTYTGIVTHFLWLWHFTWSFLCSLHMFRVFTAKIPNQLSKHDTQCVRVMKLVSLSLIGPLSIVAVSICLSYWTTDSVGYGKHSCYLDSAFLIGISVVAPVSLVSLCNLTFLAITVASIHRVNTFITFDGFKRDQFKNLILYVKLSSVTNIYWIVTIVAEAVDNDAMRMISILFNGLQGVSIFLSYICTKRVYQLYFHKTSSQPTTAVPNTSETAKL